MDPSRPKKDERLGIIRCVDGSSLRIDCCIHRKCGKNDKHCKLHIDIPAGENMMFKVDALLHKWLLSGNAIDKDAHNQLGKDLHKAFKQGEYR